MDERGWVVPMLQACVCEPLVAVIQGKLAQVKEEKRKQLANI